MKYKEIIWAGIIMLMAGCSFAGEISRDSAISAAMNYSGFFNDDDSVLIAENISASRINVLNEKFPIIEKFIRPDSAWLVKFKNVIICPSDNYIFPGVEYPREYDIFLDLHTGLLLKIISNFVTDSKIPYEIKPIPDPIPLPGQIYHDMPTKLPKHNFYDLLGGGDCRKTPKSTQFIGIYVNYSLNGEDDIIKPGWIFISGERPKVFNNPDVDGKLSRVKFSLSIINADTKEFDLIKVNTVGVE
jgi:hypothetical protein